MTMTLEPSKAGGAAGGMAGFAGGVPGAGGGVVAGGAAALGAAIGGMGLPPSDAGGRGSGDAPTPPPPLQKHQLSKMIFFSKLVSHLLQRKIQQERNMFWIKPGK